MGWDSIRTTKSFQDVFNDEFVSWKINEKIVKEEIVVTPQKLWDGDTDEEAEQYIAFRVEKGITCVVILWKRHGNEVFWKVMDETVGPYTKTKCPKEIMDLLSPLENWETSYAYAKEWRERQCGK